MLTTLDFALLGVLGLSALLGAMRGLVVEVLSLAVWVAAFWLAFMYGAQITPLFAGEVQDAAMRLFLAYALVFVAALIAGGLVTWFAGKLVQSVGLGGVDSFLGLLYGSLRGVALGCVLVLLLGFTTLPQEAQWRASPLLPQYQRGAEWMKDWLPGTVAGYVNYERADGKPERRTEDHSRRTDAPARRDR
jgi:membrane protein required for colicin V production